MKTTQKRKQQLLQLSRFSPQFRLMMERAFRIAQKTKAEVVEPKHLFAGILLDKEALAYFLLEKFGIDASETFTRLTGLLPSVFAKKVWRKNTQLVVNQATNTLIFEASRIAREGGSYYIGTEHVLLALFQGETKDLSFVKELLAHISSLPNFVNDVLRATTLPFEILRQAEDVSLPLAKPLPHVQQENGESALTMFTEHLTNRYRQFDAAITKEQRKEVTDQLLTILLRARNRNVLLVGPSGVGKSHIIDELSYRLVDGNVPISTTQKKLLRMNFPAIIAAAKFPTDVEKQVMAVLNEVYGAEEIILYIDDFSSLLAPPMRGGLNMGATFKAFLERNAMSIIASISPEEMSWMYEHNRSLLRFFSIIEVEEPETEKATGLLKDAVKQLEQEHGVTFESAAIDAAVRLTTQYIPDRVLPEKAIEILDLAASKKKFTREYKYRGLGELLKQRKEEQDKKDRLVSLGDYAGAEQLQRVVFDIGRKIKELQDKHKKDVQQSKITITDGDVRDIVSMWTKLPITTVSADETSMLLQLENKIKESIISQEDAIKQVANAVKRGRVGISSKKRPWASLLFLGPTGVGKTELAKVLAKNLFGTNEDRLIQIDMSEYMEQHSVSKLIGSPPGYVGYEQGGWLTEKISENPYSVVLFDEIEKAHPDVLNLLLQILEDGHLMDAKGNRVSFQNTIIVLTSNIGAEQIAEDKVLGFYREQKQRNLVELSTEAYDEMKEKLTKELRKKLRPELLNRLDDVIIFKGLSKTDAARVLEILITELNERLKEMNLSVNIEQKAKEYMIEKGFSAEYGARPLRRVLQHEVENLVADYVLENNMLDVKKQSELLTLDVEYKRKKLAINGK
ncbi:MAG: ATP-dependent Clp protease ATP-binding subunit [Candidatus Dojkabacteria bacterium]|nr:MAG: ATP-dependent Clp protease ATP-binding subunit [Candidatus Dojkabacteria bacterium]